ncbi:MAG TPA: magnesium/cobalt transporter CorA [Candidatus Saccharimonadales bacterium]|nr:magnesium/cobalt transporter CorA [Candidatus Saccharimonadales bacterium]
MRTLFTVDGHSRRVDAPVVEGLVTAGKETFWLDIEAPDDDDYRLLTETFKFHQLTIEDVQHQNQRPKLDEYDGYVFAVLFVIGFTNNEVVFREHHLYIARQFLVTVHHLPEPCFVELNRRIAQSPEAACRKTSFLTYLVMDALVDTTFDSLEALDTSVDQLQDGILAEATTQQLVLLQELKHDAAEMRRILGAQRDMFQRLVTHSLEQDQETTAYYRDVYDHIIRQYENVDSMRDLLTSAMDVYLSTVSNRLNLTMQTLTVVASLFLPLTFLTGFFGMNFGWLVSRIGGFPAFALGVTLMASSIVVQLVFFRRRGWI